MSKKSGDAVLDLLDSLPNQKQPSKQQQQQRAHPYARPTPATKPSISPPRILITPSANTSDAAQHYNSLKNPTQITREQSPILALKQFNNWIKATLCNHYLKRDGGNTLKLLDMACGKGGDVQKAAIAKVTHYSGCDIAEISVRQCAQRLSELRFPIAHSECISIDAFGQKLQPYLSFTPYDAVQCHFALHYAFKDKETAMQAFRNASLALRKGGYFFGTLPHCETVLQRLKESQKKRNNDETETNEKSMFGNSVYNVTFETDPPSDLDWESTHTDDPISSSHFGIPYIFYLQDAIDHCREYLVTPRALFQLAKENQFRVRRYERFDRFCKLEKENPVMASLWERMMRASQRLSAQEWEAATFYAVVVFEKE